MFCNIAYDWVYCNWASCLIVTGSTSAFCVSPRPDSTRPSIMPPVGTVGSTQHGVAQCAGRQTETYRRRRGSCQRVADRAAFAGEGESRHASPASNRGSPRSGGESRRSPTACISTGRLRRSAVKKRCEGDPGFGTTSAPAPPLSQRSGRSDASKPLSPTVLASTSTRTRACGAAPIAQTP